MISIERIADLGTSVTIPPELDFVRNLHHKGYYSSQTLTIELKQEKD